MRLYASGAISYEKAMESAVCYIGMCRNCNGYNMLRWIQDHFVLKRYEEDMSEKLSQSELDEIAEFQQYKYDTQLLLEGEDLDDMDIRDYISEHFEGNELLVVGDEELIKLHFHTNEPWLVLAYCATLGDVYDVVIEICGICFLISLSL